MASNAGHRAGHASNVSLIAKWLTQASRDATDFASPMTCRVLRGGQLGGQRVHSGQSDDQISASSGLLAAVTAPRVCGHPVEMLAHRTLRMSVSGFVRVRRRPGAN